MTVVDAVVLAMLLLAAISGFRQGLITATLTLLGAIGGAVLALWLSPSAVALVDDTAARLAIAIACVVLGVGLGELLGTAIGRRLSERITWRPAVAVERVLGLVVHTLAVLVVIWMIAVPLASVPYPWLSSAIRSSAVLNEVDRAMPTPVREVSDQLRSVFDESGFPAILDPLAPTPGAAVEAPDPAVADDPVVQAARPSILKVRSVAAGCGRGSTGTGFVIGPERLMTNAHVVAGASQVVVEVDDDSLGGQLDATVVVYDPERDLAVLEVPGLDRPALPLRTTPVTAGADAIVVGYPLDGPFTATPARVSDRITLRGPDIYQSQTVQRDVYTVRGQVRPGNSGGPLLAPDGTVSGVVFGAAVSDPDVGFVLTADEVADVVQAGLTDDVPDDTQACLPAAA
jgi:S1-C subfamily serine protease